jgi:hypothetical protein
MTKRIRSNNPVIKFDETLKLLERNPLSTKVQILNMFYNHEERLYIEIGALELLVKLNDNDINQALKMSMCNITSLLIIIIQQKFSLFFRECIKDNEKKYDRNTILCSIAMTNLDLLDVFDLTPEELVIIIRIALVHIDKQILKSFIVKHMKKINPQTILEMAIDYKNKEIVLFMLKYAKITIRVLYLAIYHEEIFTILYTKADENILKPYNSHNIIDTLELKKIDDYIQTLV